MSAGRCPFSPLLLTSETGLSCAVGEATHDVTLMGEGGRKVLEACGYVDDRPPEVVGDYPEGIVLSL